MTEDTSAAPGAGAEPEPEFGFQFEGRKYVMGNMLLSEARAIQRTTGLKPPDFQDAVLAYDADAITALVWIGRKRHGEPNLRFENVDGDISTFRPHLLDDAELEARVARAEAEAAATGASPGKSESPSPSATTDETARPGTSAGED